MKFTKFKNPFTLTPPNTQSMLSNLTFTKMRGGKSDCKIQEKEKKHDKGKGCFFVTLKKGLILWSIWTAYISLFEKKGC